MSYVMNFVNCSIAGWNRQPPGRRSVTAGREASGEPLYLSLPMTFPNAACAAQRTRPPMFLPDTAQNLWLTALLALWAALLFGGFALGKPDADHTRRMPRWTRIGSSLALVIAAW